MILTVTSRCCVHTKSNRYQIGIEVSQSKKCRFRYRISFQEPIMHIPVNGFMLFHRLTAAHRCVAMCPLKEWKGSLKARLYKHFSMWNILRWPWVQSTASGSVRLHSDSFKYVLMLACKCRNFHNLSLWYLQIVDISTVVVKVGLLCTSIPRNNCSRYSNHTESLQECQQCC